MILVLLNFLKVWSQNNDLSLRGINHNTDTTIAINIDYIRKANIKLIERKYLLKLNLEKDSIINLKNDYINEQYIIIDSLNNKLVTQHKVINNITEDLNKQKKNIIIYSVGGTLIGIIIGLIIK